MDESRAAIVDVDSLLYTSRITNGPQISEIVAAVRNRFDPLQSLAMFATAGASGRDRELWQLAQASNAQLMLIPTEVPGKSIIDIHITIRAMQESQRTRHLVLVSGDAAFVPVINAIRATGTKTTLITTAEHTAASLTLTADERIDVRDLVASVIPLEGLVPPGGAEAATYAIMQRFKSADREIAIIDPYLDVETIRLLAWVRNSVMLTLVSLNIPVKALDEIRSLRKDGRTVQLVRNRKVHDRWFLIDGRWWHSGGSLKQLGERWTRISAIGSQQEIVAHNRMLESLLSSGSNVQL
jgi:NYN domain